jgi:gliding motility-associated-like protein
MPRIFLSLLCTLIICSETVKGQTNVSGTIATNTVWTLAGSPYTLTSDVTVNAGVTLTIQPGVQVRFSSSDDIFVDGTLSAIGTATDSIAFIGEAANSGGIDLRSGSTAQLDYTKFEKMGEAVGGKLFALYIRTTNAVSVDHSRFYQNRSAVNIFNGATPSFANSKFDFNLLEGLYVTSGNPTITGTAFHKNGDKGIYLLEPATIQNCSFTNNGVNGEDAAIHIDASVIPTIENNTFSGNSIDLITHPEVVDDTYFDTNGLSRIFIDNKTVTTNSTWHFPVSPEFWDFALTGDVTVSAAATLTIQPGVQVRFSSSDDIFVDGTLSAIGTATDSIAFIGEAANNGGIDLRSGSTAQLDYTKFEKMGEAVGGKLFALYIRTTNAVSVDHSRFYQNRSAVNIFNGATPSFANSKFDFNLLEGLYVTAGNPTITGTAFHKNGDKGIYLLEPATIQSCSFTNNGVNGEDAAIHIDASVIPTIENNTFSGNSIDLITHPEVVDDAYFDTNGLSRIFIDNKTVTTNSTWHFPVSPEFWDFALTGDVTVSAAATLTIQPGVQVRFSSSDDIFVDGTLSAIGTATDSIAFIGEAANNGGIDLRTGSTAQLDYTKFEKMGEAVGGKLFALYIRSSAVDVNNSRLFNNRSGIYVTNGASPDIADTKLKNNTQYGVYVDSGSPVITDSRIEGNGVSGLQVIAGSPSISGSCISGNTSFGINNTGAGTVTATNNWWGDASGPLHLTTNTTGLGNKVSDNVLFDPWSTNPCDYVAPPPVVSVDTQPTDVEICEGEDAVFSVAASGDTGLTYRWQENSGSGFVDLANTGIYNGVSTATLQLFNIPASVSGNTYQCLIAGALASEVASTSATLTVNAFPTAPTTIGNVACGNTSVTLSAAGGTDGEYKWYTVSSGGSAISGETNSSYNTPLLTATTNYYVSLERNGCESSRSVVQATINTAPAAPTTADQSACAAFAFILSASGGSNGQYRWYDVATDGTAISGEVNSTYTTPTLSSTATYYVAINDGTCESARTSVTATINSLPSAPLVTGAAICGTGSAILAASGQIDGQYRWYEVATGGTAITGEVNSTYTTPALSATTTYYVAINDGTCESTRTPVTAAIEQPPSSPTTSGTSICPGEAATLVASGGSDGDYRWYDVETGGTAISGEQNGSLATPELTTSATYYVAINNGTCESERIPVTVTVNGPVTSPAASDISICSPQSVILVATGSTDGQYRWYDVETGGTAIVGEVNSTYTTPILSTTITYYVSINNGFCESARTAVTASINPDVTPPTTTDVSICAPESVTLTASGGAAGEYRWYDVETAGIAISGEVNSSFTTPILSATTSYYVAINNGTCESGRTPVTVEIGSDVTPPTAAEVSTCPDESATLTATGGTNGSYRWYEVATGGAGIPNQVNNTLVTPALSSDATYYVTINDGTCESTRVPVAISLLQEAAFTSQPADQSVEVGEPASFSVTASGDNITYQWQKDLRNLEGETSAELVVAAVGLDSQGNYTCTISNDCGSLVSETAILTVSEPDVEPNGGEIVVYNAVAPNGNNKNEFLKIANIESHPGNSVEIYDRWGVKVFEVSNYDNQDSNARFEGRSNVGSSLNLVEGTYFYLIQASGQKLTGFLHLRR